MAHLNLKEQALKPFWTGLFRKGEKGAVGLYPCGILTNTYHRYFLKTSENCINLWKKVEICL